MDDDINMEPHMEPFMLKGQDHSDENDLLKYQMANQQVPGYHDDSYYGRDDTDEGLAHYDNQSSFIPSHIGKEVTDSSLSNSNVGHGHDMMFDQGEGQQVDLMDQGQTNAFQPDLLNVNPFSLESTNGHKDNDFREDIFAPNNLSKNSAQQGCEEPMPSSQPPDLLMMESSPIHAGVSGHLEQIEKPTRDSGFKASNTQDNKQEAIENDFYNPDEGMDDYDDEYVDSEESDYSGYSDEKDVDETGLEQIVPEIDEKQVGTDNGIDYKLNNEVDPNIGASGSSFKEEDQCKNVLFEDQTCQSDEENENIADKPSEPSSELIKPEFSEGVASGYESDEENDTATEQQTNLESDMNVFRPENTELSEQVETNLLDTKPEGIEIIPKHSASGIDSDSSDLEERSLTPDPNQLKNLQQSGSAFQDFSEDQAEIKDVGGEVLIEEPDDSGELTDDELTDVNRNPAEPTLEQVNPFDNDNVSLETEHGQTSTEGQEDVCLMSGNTPNLMDTFEPSLQGQDSEPSVQGQDSELSVQGQDSLLMENMEMKNEPDSFDVQNQILENNMVCAKTDIETSGQNTESIDLEQPITGQGQSDSINLLSEDIETNEPAEEDYNLPEGENTSESDEDEVIENPISSEELAEIPIKEQNKEELKKMLVEEAQPEVEIKEQILKEESQVEEAQPEIEIKEQILQEQSQVEEAQPEMEIKEQILQEESLSVMETEPQIHKTEMDDSIIKDKWRSDDDHIPDDVIDEASIDQRNEPVEDVISTNQMSESGMGGSIEDKDEEIVESQKMDSNEFEQPLDEIQNEQSRASDMDQCIVQDNVCDEHEPEELSHHISKEDELLFDQMKEPGMAGLLVEDADQLLKEKQLELETQLTTNTVEQDEAYEEKYHENEEQEGSKPDISKEDELLYSQTHGENVPANLTREPEMEGSLILDEDETLNETQIEQNESEEMSTVEASHREEIPANLMKESGMEGSLVLEEGETLDDNKFENDEPEFEQSTPEMSSEDEMPINQKRESGMEGSFVLEEGETLDNKKFENAEPELDQPTQDMSPEDAIPENQNRESGMEGSFVLEEGQTFDDQNFGNDEEEEFVQSTPEVSPDGDLPSVPTRETGMEGSFVLEEGETLEDRNVDDNEEEFVQSTPEVSPDGDLPSVPTRETGMEGSFVLEEGETLEDRNVDDNEEEFVQSTPEVSPDGDLPSVPTRESGMEGSFVLEEGETLEDKHTVNNEEEFEQSTPEVSAEEEMPTTNIKESGMEGSLVLEEGETFADKNFDNEQPEFEQSTPEVSPDEEIPASQKRESGMEGSFVLEEGQTFEDKQFENEEEEFIQSTPETTPEEELPANQNQFMEETQQPQVNEIKEPSLEESIVPVEEMAFSESMVKDQSKIELETEEPAVETPVDSYGEDGDIDSSIQSPLSQDGMVQSPSSDVNETINVQQENEKNLMSSSLIEDETIEAYQPCVQNGISHSESEDASPHKEDVEPPYYQNGISQSASEEFTPEKEIKITEDLSQKEEKHVSICEEKPEVKEVISKVKTKENLQSKKTGTDVKKTAKEIPKKKTQFTKLEPHKKEVSKDIKKDTLSKLPSSTKTPAEKRSVSASRTTTTPPSKTTKPTTRMPRDTTRKARPTTTTTEPTKPTGSRQRPKSIDISRTSSLTRPTASSLNKARTFEKPTPEGGTSPTKPFRSSSKTTTSRYRIPKSKKDGSDSGLEEEKTPRKPETPKTGQNEKVTRSTSAKRSTIPTMNKTPTKSEGSPKKTTGKTTPTRPAQSKIGSLDNARYTPGGGQVKIQSKKPDFSNVTSKIGSKDHMDYKPAGGDKKIMSKKLEWKAESKVGSLKNATYSPGGGKVKIQSEKLSWNVQSKVGSLDNASHSPGGGHVKIKSELTKWKSESRIGSLENSHYVPSGGNVQIHQEKLNWKAGSKVGSLENAGHIPGGGNVHVQNNPVRWNTHSKIDSLSNAHYNPGGGNFKITEEKLVWNVHSKVNSLDNAQYSSRGGTNRFPFGIENKKLDFKDKAHSKVGSKDYITHKPGGGDKKIESQKLDFKEKAHSKVGSKDNMDHKPLGGDKKIESQKLDFKEKAHSKVGSKDNMDHKPLGGDKKIESQKLNFKESAKPRTDTGVANGKTRPDSGIECEKTEASI